MQERNQDRNNIIECLKMLGFNIFTLDRFFRFLRDQAAKTEALIESIEGGVNMSGRGTGSEHWFIQYERREIRNMASTVASLMIPADQRLDDNLEHIMAHNVDPLRDQSLSKSKCELFKSFFTYFMQPEIFGEKAALSKFRSVIDHWRAVLDTYRVNLLLAGKNSYPTDIKEADLFLRVLESEGFRNRNVEAIKK